VNEEIIDSALIESSSDFEYAIQHITAEKNKIDFVITRNKKDYKKSKVPVLEAKEFLLLSKNQ